MNQRNDESCDLRTYFLFAGDQVFGSTLEVRGQRDRTQSLSNVDILISPCDPAQRPEFVTMETSEEKPGAAAEKTQLEAAASFPLERSKVTQYLSSPYSPTHQDASPSMPRSEEGGETPGGNHSNGGEEEEQLPVEDRMYPTLRSKSLNANPRKTRQRPTGSVSDLVSAFSGGAGRDQDQLQKL